MDLGLLIMVVKSLFGCCCGKTVTVCHVCCEVGTFIPFFFIINVKCSLDFSFFDHMMQRRAFVLKADTLGWIFFKTATLQMITSDRDLLCDLYPKLSLSHWTKFTFDIKFCSNVRNWRKCHWLLMKTYFMWQNTDNHNTEVLFLFSSQPYCF